MVVPFNENNGILERPEKVNKSDTCTDVGVCIFIDDQVMFQLRTYHLNTNTYYIERSFNAIGDKRTGYNKKSYAYEHGTNSILGILNIRIFLQ